MNFHKSSCKLRLKSTLINAKSYHGFAERKHTRTPACISDSKSFNSTDIPAVSDFQAVFNATEGTSVVPILILNPEVHTRLLGHASPHLKIFVGSCTSTSAGRKKRFFIHRAAANPKSWLAKVQKRKNEISATIHGAKPLFTTGTANELQGMPSPKRSGVQRR